VTVSAKKTEFICMGCWGTFTPQPDADGDVICPHCGARQELKHEPIDLDPDEFVELGPEAAVSATGPDVADDGGDARAKDATSDDDFDAVIEIDLDEIDANDDFVDVSQYTEPIPEADAPAEDLEPSPASQPEAAEAGAPLSLYFIRTEFGHVYTFLSPEALAVWARRLKQAQKSLQISLDGVDWEAFLPFFKRLADTGQLPEIEGGRDDLREEADVSDEDLARSLDEEKHDFAVNGPLPPQDAPKGVEGAAKTVDAGPARGVGDFTFKLHERVETPLGRYALMLGVGVVLGAGIVTILALLGVLPPTPF
jgi:DNA-directed RNA polymerase subunit RPC12/RpoP